MQIKTIITANIAEVFETSINKISSPEERDSRILIEHNLCNRSLLWEGDDKVVITPYPIDKDLFEHNRNVLGYRNVSNLFPERVGVSLSKAIIEDPILLQQVIEIIRNNPGINISPYCVTEKFFSLVNLLRKEGLSFIITERPAKQANWLVQYLDSKVGSRIEIGKISNPQIEIPESFPCRTKEEAINVARWFYTHGRSSVIKTNFGESGWGLVMLRKIQFKSMRDLVLYINKEFRKTQIWDNDLILVEEFIEPIEESKTQSPSSELFLSAEKTTITYICNQVLGANGTFFGVAIGKGIMDQELSNRIHCISTNIGNRFRQLGYRGFFDIDFVHSQQGNLYIIETNMRRTGGTHVYDTVKFLIGDKWEQRSYALSNDDFTYGISNLSTSEILTKLSDILYPIQGGKEGILLSIINRRQPHLGFIIIGETRERVLGIHTKLIEKFGLQIE